VVERRRSAVRAAAEQLRRVVPFVERVVRRMRLLAVVTLAGGAAIWWWLADRGSREQTRTLNLAIWAVVLVAAPAILFVLSLALHQLTRLPDRLRELPDRAGAHGAELRRLAEETRRVRERGRARTTWSVIRLWRRAAASRELLDLAAPAAFLFSPMTLTAAIFALAAAVVEIVVGAVVLVLLLD
jgi:hypothetical protein